MNKRVSPSELMSSAKPASAPALQGEARAANDTYCFDPLPGKSDADAIISRIRSVGNVLDVPEVEIEEVVEHLFDHHGAPSRRLMKFASRYSQSLDFIIAGDVSALIRILNHGAKEQQPKECAVLRLAREAERLIHAKNVLDRYGKHEKAGPRADELEQFVDMRRDHLLTETSYQVPETQEGAVFQLLLAAADLSDLSSSEFHCEWQQTEVELRAQRLISSSIEYLCKNSQARRLLPESFSFFRGYFAGELPGGVEMALAQAEQLERVVTAEKAAAQPS